MSELPARVDPSEVTDANLAALVRAIQAGRERATPEVALPGPLPREIDLLVRAYAWHDLASLRIGDAELVRPRRVTTKNLRGSAKEALQLGMLGNGDPVIARLSKQSATIVEVNTSDGGPDRKHASLGSFLVHCLVYAREHQQTTPLDPYLPPG